jgi:TRAP-type C4-dicarboxylate transport system substrate-binding protein
MKQSILAGLALAAMLAAPAPAQDRTFELKFSTWLPPSHGVHPVVKEWSDSIEKASKGTIKVTLYPAQQLGKAEDHQDMARDGIADITYISVGYQPGRLPIGEAANLPFLFANASDGSMAYDEWYRKNAARELSEVRYCLAYVHDPAAIYTKNRVVKRPEDLRGAKLRASNTQTGQFISLMGGVPVRVSAPESRAALESGVAEGTIFPWRSVLLFGIDKVITNIVDLNFSTTGQAWLLNPDTYKAMSAAQKKVMDDHCSTAWAGKVGKTWGDYEATGRAELKAKPGIQAYQPTGEEMALWKAATLPIRKTWLEAAKKAGAANPEALLADFEATIAKYKAGL